MTNKERGYHRTFILLNVVGAVIMGAASIVQARVGRDGYAVTDVLLCAFMSWVAVKLIGRWRQLAQVMARPVEIQATVPLGWRTWIVRRNGEGWALGSVTADYLWPERTPAQGRVERGSMQGVHAYRKREDAERHARSLRRCEAWAVGTVAVAGTMVEHETGWRADYGYPQTIEIGTKNGSQEDARRIARDLANRYGVEVAGGTTPRSGNRSHQKRTDKGNITCRKTQNRTWRRP